MFVYFNSNGVLEEIVSGVPFRQTNSDVNHIYIFIENAEGEQRDEEGVILLPNLFAKGFERYRLGNGTITGEMEFSLEPVVAFIPYNSKRDLKFFKYT